MTNSQFSALKNTVTLAFAFCLFTVLCSTSAQAGAIRIDLAGLSILYDGGNDILRDIEGSGGVLDPNDADVLTSVAFNLDGVPVANLMMGDGGGDLYGDLLIDNAGASIPLGAFSTIGGGGAAFGFDLFTVPNSDIPLLRLNMDEVELFINGNVVFFFGDATVISEDLPAGLSFGVGNTVAFSYAANFPSVNTNLATTTMFAASGVATISGLMAIPEPTTAALLMLGFAPLSLLARRRVA